MLRAESLWVETFTGLRMRQFGRPLNAVRERGGDGPGGGRPWCLPSADRVLLVAVHYRTDLTMRQLAPLFARSSATVCRVIQRLRPLRAIEPATCPCDAVERLWIVGGARSCPARERAARNIDACWSAWNTPFARTKHYEILRDCRQHGNGNGLDRAVRAVATLHNHALAA